MRLHRAARNELARLAPGGNLTPQTIADAIGGSAAADKLTARARTLNEAEVAGILAAGYATGRAKPDFPWDRAGGRLMSVMAFTPHPPIRLRTQLLCVRKLYNPTMGFVALFARRSAAVSHSGHGGGTVRTGSVIKMPVGLALPFGSADHWVGEVPCPGPGA
jgi:hypothetical protein